MKTKLMVYIVGVALIATTLSACTTTQKGAALGGALGAGAGAIIGNQSGKEGEGALIGAAGGALAGALIGDQVGQHKAKSGTQQVQAQPKAAPAPSSGTPVLQKSAGHYETRTVTSQSGETYQERVWVPDK